VTDEELGIFADSGAVASNNPGSNLRLSTGICRLRDIMDTGGRVAFGTDGISFSDRDDMFTEVRLATYLQRMPRNFNKGRLDSEQVLRAAASNGAQALGMSPSLGSLEPGKLADLLVINRERIMFPPGRYANEPFLDVVIDRADARDIDTVLVNGRVLMEDGRVTVVDERQVKQRFAAAVAERVYRPSAQQRRYAELGTLVEPYLAGFYRSWYELPLEPAHVYNTRHPPANPGGPGAS
jgi:5-methylthioadenosine/S-adenosylhomocysteine deaminase